MTSTAKPRTGIPVWRVGKPDAFLAAAVDVARNAVETIAKPAEIGPHIAARSEGERVVTHLFESRLAGYGGWQWYAVVTRNSRSKVVTVSELGLLPSEDSILAPEWVPWQSASVRRTRLPRPRRRRKPASPLTRTTTATLPVRTSPPRVTNKRATTPTTSRLTSPWRTRRVNFVKVATDVHLQIARCP
ncbi:uncharacterized protein Mb0901 [Arthrobacter sp. Hiyo8]|nr:uncharacterized protein Mb0901 [Arthrobacter sp. Hiyo8]